MIRVVATADNHLGRGYDRMFPKKLEARREYLRQGFEAAVHHAISWNAHIFVIAGDVFDTPDPRNADRSYLASAITRLHEAGILIYAISGNHDMPHQSTEQGGVAPLHVYHTLGAITYFESATDIQSATLMIDDVRIAIGGMSSDPLISAERDPLQQTTWHRHDAAIETSILLLHGQVEGHAVPNIRGTLFPIHSLLEKTDADVIIMGDLHQPAVIPLDSRRRVIIPGSTERMTFGETEESTGFAALEYSSERGWQVQRIHHQSQPRAEITILTAQLPENTINDYIIERIRKQSSPETLVKVTIQGTITRAQHQQLMLRKIQEKIAPYVFHCAFDTSELALEDWLSDSASRGVRLSHQEEIALLAGEKMAETNDPDRRAIWDAARERLLAAHQTCEKR